MENNIIFGLEVMIIGFAVVMAILYLLYLILLGFSKVCVRPSNNESRKGQLASPTSAVLDEVGSAPVAAGISQSNYNYGTAPEIVAAITATISAYLDLPAAQFQIVSLQPSHSAGVVDNWALLGRKRAIEKRQDLAMYRRERKT
ncbi:MAG: OadG family protein [Clostridiales bacterium]|jgi:Na+-transporting methylmalonyl-CoA/oxaloacetate decarboxylase gamma subunit|nr:OadG family protein [Clostridiales bacterium]